MQFEYGTSIKFAPCSARMPRLLSLASVAAVSCYLGLKLLLLYNAPLVGSISVDFSQHADGSSSLQTGSDTRAWTLWLLGTITGTLLLHFGLLAVLVAAGILTGSTHWTGKRPTDGRKPLWARLLWYPWTLSLAAGTMVFRKYGPGARPHAVISEIVPGFLYLGGYPGFSGYTDHAVRAMMGLSDPLQTGQTSASTGAAVGHSAQHRARKQAAAEDVRTSLESEVRSASESEPLFHTVVDLTCDLEQRVCHPRYVCVPTWDGYPPTVAQLDTAVAAILDARTHSHRVLVHCQYGIGRSCMVVCAALYAMGLCADWRDAYTFVTIRRPVVKLSPSYKKRLTEWTINSTLLPQHAQRMADERKARARRVNGVAESG